MGVMVKITLMDPTNNENQIDRLDPFLIEYFKYLREEINLRIIKHSDLVLYKIVSIGAILAFILGSFKTPHELIDLMKNTLFLIWVVPLVSMIFDVIIFGNLRVVANIGIYIKENYEEKVFTNWKGNDKTLESFKFWESDGAHNQGIWKCFTRFDITIIYSVTIFSIFLIFLTTLILAYQSAIDSYYFLNIIISIIMARVSYEIYNNMCKILKVKEILFSWDGIPGNDSGELVEFLRQNYGIDWAKTVKIDKIDNGNTITVSTEKNHISLKLNPEKTKVNLTIDDGRIDEFIVKTENGQLNICVKEN